MFRSASGTSEGVASGLAGSAANAAENVADDASANNARLVPSTARRKGALRRLMAARRVASGRESCRDSTRDSRGASWTGCIEILCLVATLGLRVVLIVL